MKRIIAIIFAMILLSACSNNQETNNIESSSQQFVESTLLSEETDKTDKKDINNTEKIVNALLDEYPIAYEEQIDNEYLDKIGISSDFDFYGIKAKTGSSLYICFETNDTNKINLQSQITRWIDSIPANYEKVEGYEKEKIENIFYFEFENYIIICIPEAQLFVEDFGWNYVKERCQTVILDAIS